MRSLISYLLPFLFPLQFGPPGRAYVYLCYGLHHMLNVTVDAEGRPAACLIRAAQLVAGQ